MAGSDSIALLCKIVVSVSQPAGTAWPPAPVALCQSSGAPCLHVFLSLPPLHFSPELSPSLLPCFFSFHPHLFIPLLFSVIHYIFFFSHPVLFFFHPYFRPVSLLLPFSLSLSISPSLSSRPVVLSLSPDSWPPASVAPCHYRLMLMCPDGSSLELDPLFFLSSFTCF